MAELDTQTLREHVPASAVFDVGAGLSEREARERFAQQGPNEVPEPPHHPLRRFAKKFWGPSAWMLEAIAVLSWILHKRPDFWLALGLLLVNALIGAYQQQRASAALAALRRQLDLRARVLRDGTWGELASRLLVVGDVVRLRAGDLVPADLRLAQNPLSVDQSALTGESRELEKNAGEIVYSGSTVRRGEATGVVVATGVRTYFGRTVQLVENAAPKLHVEEVIARVVRWLLIIVGTLVALTLVVALLAGMSLLEILPLCLVLLMSAIPVALPVMFTVSMAVGSMELGRRGVLVTRLSAIEDAANMDVLCADKTGTLTMNRLALTGTLPEPGFTDADVVLCGALASNEANADPIDVAFLRAAAERSLLDEHARVVSFQPFSASSRRTEANVELGAARWRVVKGALRTLAELSALDPSALGVLEERASQEAVKGVRDGVNDAPALRQAEVGIAVSGASDVAKGAAGAVLTTDGLAGIVDLVKIGRSTYQRVLTWIINKVSRTILKAGFVVGAFLFTGRFVISALGMVLLVFLTDFVKVALATDRVHPSPKPETWEIGPLVRVAVVLGVVMLAESLGLLALGWLGFGLGSSEGRLHTFTFQTLLFFALFSILSVRERRAFFRSKPGGLLAAGLAADAVIGVLVGATGISDLQVLPLRLSAVVFGFAAFCALGPNDWLKVRLMRGALEVASRPPQLPATRRS